MSMLGGNDMVHYNPHNSVLKYWVIRINSTLSDEDCTNIPFKGKTIEGAIKAAQNYCKRSNARLKYKTLTVGEVLYESDFWGRKVAA